MAAPTPGRPFWRGLGAKLFASYVAVVAAGIATLLLAADVVAPSFFDAHMARMPGPGTSVARMMEPGRLGAMDEALAEAFRSALQQALALSGVAALAAAGGASLFVAARVVGPLRRTARASQRIAAGDYAERVPPGGDDELGDLGTSFNAMAAALQAVERRRVELIGDVAHEMRTPLATIEGSLEGLLDGVVAPEPATWARLHGEAGRLRRLVDDLQELSRAEARQLRLSPRAVPPGELVRVAVQRLADAFAEGGLALESEVEPALPAVRADPERAVQVLTNLLTNALRYTPAPGRVLVTAWRAAEGVELAVTDTGVGIAADDLPRVFERFYRVDKSRSRALGGSGVGLTIAKALVEAMGGRMRAESAGPGRGATFAFTLPAA